MPDAGPEASFAVGGKTGSGGAAPIHAGGAHAAGGATAQAGSGSALGTGGVAGTGGTGITASGGSDTVDAGGARDGGMPMGTGGAPPCTSDVQWYADGDEDGYGTTTLGPFACPKPMGKWALDSGDCNDQDARVHPKQTRYFGSYYLTLDGSYSFDYDCSGMEEPNPSLNVAKDCGAILNLALCSGVVGYEKNTAGRGGPGVNEWCGSTKTLTCNSNLILCQAIEATGQPPFSCK